MARYDERDDLRFGADNRDRWRGDDRERSGWRAGGPGGSEREDERGFFQRAGDEIRSWFNEDDDRSDRDHERGRFSGRSWDRDDRRFGGTGSGWSSGSYRDRGRGISDRERERRYGRMGRGGSDYEENRGYFGGVAQGGSGHSPGGPSWGRRDQDYGPSSDSVSWSRSNNPDQYGSSRRSFGGFRDESDFRSHRRDYPRSRGEVKGGDDGSLGYGELGGTLGGFGNQTIGSSEHDHYRSWRDREMSKLDRDYADYCREREQKFNQDFDSWRRERRLQNPPASDTSPDLGSSSNAGVGTTTASVTGSAGSGTAPASATTHGGTIQSDTTGSTETAGSGGSRSGSRSRS